MIALQGCPPMTIATKEHNIRLGHLFFFYEHRSLVLLHWHCYFDWLLRLR